MLINLCLYQQPEQVILSTILLGCTKQAFDQAITNYLINLYHQSTTWQSNTINHLTRLYETKYLTTLHHKLYDQSVPSFNNLPKCQHWPFNAINNPIRTPLPPPDQSIPHPSSQALRICYEPFNNKAPSRFTTIWQACTQLKVVFCPRNKSAILSSISCCVNYFVLWQGPQKTQNLQGNLKNTKRFW